MSRVRVVNHPALRTNVWIVEFDGPKYLRGADGIRHKVFGFNDYDSRLVLSDCGLLSAWPYDVTKPSKKYYLDCEECFG